MKPVGHTINAAARHLARVALALTLGLALWLLGAAVTPAGAAFGSGTNNAWHIRDYYDQGCDKGPASRGGPSPGALGAGANESQCAVCQGMPGWWVTEPYLNVWVADEPLSYQTSSGQTMSFRWTHRQRFYLPYVDSWFQVGAIDAKPLGRDGRYFSDVRTMGFTNASWQHNWSSDIVFWSHAWETNTVKPPQVFQEGWDAFVFLAEGGIDHFTVEGGPLDPRTFKTLWPLNKLAYPTVEPAAALSDTILWARNSTNGFYLRYPDGSKDIYDLTYYCWGPLTGTTTNTNTLARALLTKRIDPQGRVTRLGYERSDPGSGAYFPLWLRLKYVVDPDGRTNTYEYTSDSPWYVTQVKDPYGRTARLHYAGTTTNQFDPGPYALNQIIDAAGLTNTFEYTDRRGFMRRLVTPYGPTTFQYYDALPRVGVPQENAGDSAVQVTEANGARQLYYYRQQANDCLPANLPEPPQSVAKSTFDNGTLTSNESGAPLYYRNSLYWGRRQYTALSTAAVTVTNEATLVDCLTNLTVLDFQKGRWKHWLAESDRTNISDRISLERAPSRDADGQTEGPKTWYDYAGKDTNHVYALGDQRQPATVAQFVDYSTTRFVQYRYSALGSVTSRVASYTDINGAIGTRTNSYAYGGGDINLTEEAGPEGHWVGRGYNGDHQMTSVTNALNDVTQLGYDSATHQLTSLALPGGLSATLSYYPSNAATANGGFLSNILWQPTGRWLSFSYTNGQVWTVANERALSLSLTWDGLNRLTSIGYPDTTYTSNRYEKLDLAATRDRLGHWTYYDYDALRHLRSVTNALTNVTQFSWCDCGSLEGIVDALTHPTTFAYDNQGHMTNATFADGSRVRYDYDAFGQRVAVTDGTGRGLTYAHNLQGLVTVISNAFGPVMQLSYDAQDRPATLTNSLGVVVTSAWDALGRPLSRAWPGGSEGWGDTTHVQGATSFTNANGGVVRYAYDPAGRLTNLVHVDSFGLALSTNGFTYDPDGALTTLTDGNAKTTTWNRDAYGRVTRKVAPGAVTVWTNGFDANGQVTAPWTPVHGLATYGYDSVGNLLTETNAGRAFGRGFAYDALNQVTNVVALAGSQGFTNRFAYTAAGELQAESGPWPSSTVTFAYTNGHRLRLDLQQPGAAKWVATYSYVEAWRMLAIASPVGTFGYGYADPGGRLLAQPSGLTLPNYAYITNSYDELGRLQETDLVNRWGHVLDGYAYGLDALGQRRSATRDFGLAVTTNAYAYDALGQLKTALGTDPGGVARLNEQFGYAYDAAGNLRHRTNATLTQSFGVNDLNALTTITRTTALTLSGATPVPATNVWVNGQEAARYADFTWASSNGFALSDSVQTFTNVAEGPYGQRATNLLSVKLPGTVTVSYDANGNLTNDGWRTFEYDAADQLTAVWVTNGWRTEFVYDGLGRKRIERDYVRQGGTWTSTNETRLVYDGLLAIQERDAANTPLVTYPRGLDLSLSLQGAGGIGGLLGRTDAHGTTYYHADGGGNVTALMDNRGDVVARYLYAPYGNLIGQWGALADANRYRFSSKEWQFNAGLYYYGYRFYDPNQQRWVNRDPIAEHGGINLSQFVANNPLGFVDPLGLAFSYRSTAEHPGELLTQGVPGPMPYIKSGGSQPDRWFDFSIATFNNVLATGLNSISQIAQMGGQIGASVERQFGGTGELGQSVGENLVLLALAEAGMSRMSCAAKETQGLRSLMTADEAARYDAYWAQELSGPTRQRLQVAPGTQSITDAKLSTQSGQPYARQTIYDEYGRATGVNDSTTHGRPQAHTDPHYHTIDSQNWKGGVSHGPATPGLHPDTP
jgi:RHS repeat-associated protein